MKTTGLVLITIGFLTGAWIAVQQVETVRWAWYAPMFVLGAIGVVLARQGALQRARAADTLQEHIQTVRSTLDRVVQNIDALEAKKTEIETHDLRTHIDATFAEDLADFADARESIAHLFGLSNYAEVMNHFAAGERYLNRVWSASVDGYVDECLAYVTHAQEQFHQAHERLAACT
jgi:uncharacterized protein YicC (UPF0701 family)